MQNLSFPALQTLPEVSDAYHASQPVAPSTGRFRKLLQRFDTINIADLDAVALLDRTDTKYVLSNWQLYEALTAIAPAYRVLEIDGIRLSEYQTLYFDTPGFELYLRHHAGAQPRYKVRSRRYVDSDLSFFEAKFKSGNERTIKRRLETPELVDELTPELDAFLQRYVPVEVGALEPKLWTDFARITLVSKYRHERLTLDLSLQFRADGKIITLPDVAIAEVKQSGVDRNSDFIRQMREMHIHQMGFSKYCIGVSLAYSHIKHNNFKPKLRKLEKLTQGEHYG